MIDQTCTDLAAYIAAATTKCANALMDTEASAYINAAHYERSGTRTAYRNGYRTRRWRTAAGTVVLHIPKLRSGSYYPAFLERDGAEEQFAELAMQALLQSINPDEVHHLLTDADDTPTAIHLSSEFNAAAREYLTRRLRHPYPNIVVEQRSEQVIVYGERHTGTRHLLDVQPAEGGIGFWRAVVGRWLKRGLVGVEQMQGSGLTDEARRAIRTAFPQANHTQVLVYPQGMVTALGKPLQPQPIDRSKPHGLLLPQYDAALALVIDDSALTQLRRLMRDQRDAIGEPLRRVA